MKTLQIVACIFLLIIFQTVPAQQIANPWEKWGNLIGGWVAEDDEQSPGGTSFFSFPA